MTRTRRSTDPLVLYGEVAERRGLGDALCTLTFEGSSRHYVERPGWHAGLECARVFRAFAAALARVARELLILPLPVQHHAGTVSPPTRRDLL